jgi:hypothetical protein
MFDRFVRQINPPQEDSIIRRPFSAYLETPNIVLLGDPGSGKSYLFEKTVETSGGSFLTARAFLNTPSTCLNTVLFIDALDERRAGRGDNNTIDIMVHFPIQLKQAAQPLREAAGHDWRRRARCLSLADRR